MSITKTTILALALLSFTAGAYAQTIRGAPWRIFPVAPVAGGCAQGALDFSGNCNTAFAGH